MSKKNSNFAVDFGGLTRVRRRSNRTNTNEDMIIDFPNMPVEVIPQFKGGEKELSVQTFFDGVNKIMHGILIPGASIGLHTHEENSEILFVLAGKGTILEDGEEKVLRHGQCTYCPKGHSHSLINTSEDRDLEFYAVVPQQ